MYKGKAYDCLQIINRIFPLFYVQWLFEQIFIHATIKNSNTKPVNIAYWHTFSIKQCIRVSLQLHVKWKFFNFCIESKNVATALFPKDVNSVFWKNTVFQLVSSWEYFFIINEESRLPRILQSKVQNMPTSSCI